MPKIESEGDKRISPDTKVTSDLKRKKSNPESKRGLAYLYDGLDPEDFKNIGKVRIGENRNRTE